ncbi:AraC-like DNA-binding protein [Paraburkholderia sp. CI2]|nr:AraC-like DNA-binding protein [Paraburkholderia sp. CI2]
MASKTTGIAPLQMFESVVIRLYDGGVLSPAVLERVIGAFAQADVDWHDTVEGRSVDGRSLHEIVALTMLPGQPVRSASASFMTVIEHIAGVAPDTDEKAAQPKTARRKKTAPHAYLVRLRLRAARRLLATGRTPAQVAAEVGFADQSHLGRWFRRAYRMTPAAYRQMCTNVPDRSRGIVDHERLNEESSCSIPKWR